MKKLLTISLVAICLLGCENPLDTSAVSSAKNNLGMVYFRDPQTNLCFAKYDSDAKGGYTISSITCVPCDSLKNLGI